jgi:hypothetical protein
MKVKIKNTVVVLEHRSVERMVENGGTSSWHLVRNRARRCDYVVCTRNGKRSDVEGTEPHRSAFLIAKIRDVVPSPTVDGRWLIQFSEYARLNIREVWPKGNRNPVGYACLEDIGIDPFTLEWEKMPKAGKSPAYAPHVSSHDSGLPNGNTPLTIPEAKKRLAITYGVPPEAIEITIRG